MVAFATVNSSNWTVETPGGQKFQIRLLTRKTQPSKARFQIWGDCKSFKNQPSAASFTDTTVRRFTGIRIHGGRVTPHTMSHTWTHSQTHSHADLQTQTCKRHGGALSHSSVQTRTHTHRIADSLKGLISPAFICLSAPSDPASLYA